MRGGASGLAVLNHRYCELARHYGFQIDPTPPRSPEKKGKVERDVRCVRGNFLASWQSIDMLLSHSTYQARAA